VAELLLVQFRPLQLRKLVLAHPLANAEEWAEEPAAAVKRGK
jgi:hypothetical protein